MVGRFTTGSTTTRLMVWLLLIAFSICLSASTAFSRQRPYDIKTVTHAVKETDDGGWGDPHLSNTGGGVVVSSQVRQSVTLHNVGWPFTHYLLNVWSLRQFMSIADEPKEKPDSSTSGIAISE